MPNPILNKLLVGSNPMFNMFQQIRNGNPKQIATQIIQNNPNAKNVINALQNSKMSPKDYAIKCMRDRGIYPSQITDMAQSMGIKL